MPERILEYDVAVVGSGMAGLGAGIFLAQAGLKVICIEPQPFPHAPVGESLDWSAPGLLQSLGLRAERLISDRVATRKQAIQVVAQNGRVFQRTPDYRLIRKLSRVAGDTIHVDRCALDQHLYAAAQSLGVSFLWDRVAKLSTAGDDRILTCHTTGGHQITAPWFVDASGRTRLFARTFGIPRRVYGRRKVCLWTCLEAASSSACTTFYIRPDDDYLAWTWEIPITPQRVSIGYVTSAEAIQNRRRQGRTAAQILAAELAHFPRLADLLDRQPAFNVRTTAFQGYTSARSSGANWLLVGEAAAMADPLTGNGVTAALRHARAATRLILAAQGQPTLSISARRKYDASVQETAHIFNQGIESLVYAPPVRRGLGPITAVSAYVLLGFFTNAFYADRLLDSRLKQVFFRFWLSCMQFWIKAWMGTGNLAGKLLKRGTHAVPKHTETTGRSRRMT